METINFKGYEIDIKYSDIEFVKFMEKVGEKHNKKYEIFEDEEIDLTVFNLNLTRTILRRYYYKNSKNETIYVVQDAIVDGDDVSYTFYFCTKKIEDIDIKELLQYVDEENRKWIQSLKQKTIKD